MKFGIAETCERIKEEFNMIQNQYHSLKLDCEKLAQEKQEMQRHYIMVSTAPRGVYCMPFVWTFFKQVLIFGIGSFKKKSITRRLDLSHAHHDDDVSIISPFIMKSNTSLNC